MSQGRTFKLVLALLRNSRLSLLTLLSVCVYSFKKIMELCIRNGFFQRVKYHFRSWNVLEGDKPSSYFVTNIFLLDVNIIRLSAMDWVVDKSNRAFVITFLEDKL